MIRFATWAAVSTLEQVDGASLDNQITKCTERGQSEGWVNTGLRYIADGYSRTGYVNLSDAERDIPPLAQMLADMRGNKYDVLVCWNYDRFGDLVVPIITDFRNHKKQLFSVSQPTPVSANYDPYMDDAAMIIQSLAPIWQKQRIADLQRKKRTGMPRRIERGLTAGKVPFGYTWRGKQVPPEPVPAELNLIKRMRDMLMGGATVTDIRRMCDASGIASPHGHVDWDDTTIKEILKNSYYADGDSVKSAPPILAPQDRYCQEIQF